MELTRKQEEGLAIALYKYRNNYPYTCIAGYAGTGKSTLIKFIVAALALRPEEVAYIAYTGKAAQVLRSKGCPTAMTAHRLLYKSIQMPDGTFKHFPRLNLPEYKLIIVDEISMLPDKMWKLLLSHKIHVIACGDPFQLPPIGDDNHVLEHPDIFLDEIMRQAQESEIIRLTMDIRDRKPPKPFKGKEINIVPQKEFSIGMMTWADQVLCGKNQTRYELNDLYREMIWGKGVGPEPKIGDRVICLKNNWEKVTEIGEALVNGTIGEITKMTITPSKWLEQTCTIDFQPDNYDDIDVDTSFHNLIIDWKLITAHEPTLNKKNFAMFPRFLRPEQFDYGYVVTVHKAQGSEYPKVLVIEEMLKATDHARWLYTACTRPSEKLTLVLKD